MTARKTRLASPAVKRTAAPVTVSRRPVVRCQACQQAMAYDPAAGTASQVLTSHYSAAHSGGRTRIT